MELATLLTALCGLLLPGTHPAQAQAEAASGPRVVLAQSVGPPGGTVSVPVQLTGFEGASVGSLTLRLTFTTARLTFSKVEIGGVGEAAGVDVATETQAREAETLLEIKITTHEQDGAKAPIPDGPVAQVLFTVAKGLKPETVIQVKLEAGGTGQKAGAAPVKVAAKDGEIIVSNPPVIGCFFYMH